MDGADQLDDLTFRVNFGGDGVAKLRERVKDKLKEFMGDYTDDTLVEYVIVLLKNGRRKVEAKNELNVFLGDDSDSFVSWLWDHLGSNLDLYVQPGEHRSEEAIRTVPMLQEHAVKEDSGHLDSEADRERSDKVIRNRHRREWKDLVKNNDEPPPLRSVVTTIVNIKDHKEVDHSKQSSRQTIQRKRSRPDEQHQVKRDIGSKSKMNAPRRLLQFAVRDAVGTSLSSSTTTEPSMKRLRSVVEARLDDDPRARMIRSAPRMPNTFAVAIKAVADAAKDVVRLKSQSNVFDRLGPGTENVAAHTVDRIPESLDTSRNFGRIQDETRLTLSQQSDSILESNDDQGFDDVNTSNEGDDSVMVNYSVVADSAGEVAHKQWNGEGRSTGAVASSTSSKMANTDVNVNMLINTGAVEAEKEKSCVRTMKENSNPTTVDNGKAFPAADAQKEPLKTLPSPAGLYPTGRPTENADSRTIFISNVHFAATKDSLSRHFNKFGDVLKVIIVTDAATGQPKGSAYVEFMRKEAAEHALSLDGTSFMSRILKVVRKSAAHQEATPMITWPRVTRGSPFTASRFGRVPFSRGMPSIYRGRLPIKTGARSMQWKRDAQPSDSTVPSPTARGLTYVRSETKINGN